MFNWVVEERPDFVNYTHPQKVEHGRKIISIKSNNQNLTVLEQLLIASVVRYDYSTRIQLNTGHAYPIQTRVFSQLQSHFERILLFKGDEYAVVVMSDLNDESKRLFFKYIEQDQISPFIMDLYRVSDTNISKVQTTISWCKIINLPHFDVNESADWTKILDFWIETATNNWILLTPTGWEFRDELKYSILLRALLVSGCGIYLGITANKNIRFIFASINCKHQAERTAM